MLFFDDFSTVPVFCGNHRRSSSKSGCPQRCRPHDLSFSDDFLPFQGSENDASRTSVLTPIKVSNSLSVAKVESRSCENVLGNKRLTVSSYYV